MTTELFLGAIILTVLLAGGWAILQVLAVTFTDPDWNDIVDEVEQEREFLEAAQRAARR